MNSEANQLIIIGVISLVITKLFALLLIPDIDLFTYYSVTTSLRVVGAALCLSLIGYSFSLIFSPWYFNFKSHFFHSTFIAQVFLTLYLLSRSFINFIFESINLSIIRIGTADFIIISLLLLITAYFYRRKKYQDKKIRSYLIFHLKHLKSGFILLYLFFLLMIFVTASETPRVSLLSTDPNIHAYFTHLISRFGTGLYEFRENGIQLQRYPSGFSYLNFIWSELTGLDALNTVTIQTTLQLFVAAFIVCEFVLRKKSTALINFLILPLSLIFIILFFLPYGYQLSNFHLEGTARTSLLSAYAFLMSFVLIFHSSIEKINHKINAKGFSKLIIIITYLFVFITNPINAAVYLIILIGNSLIKKKGFVIIMILLFLSSFVLFIDTFVMSGVRSVIKPVDNTNFISHSNEGVRINDINLDQLGLSALLAISSNFKEIAKFDSISSQGALIILLTICLGYSLIKHVVYPKETIYEAYIMQFVILFFGFCLLTIVVSVFQANSIFGAGYLLQSYFNFSIVQVLYILLLFGISLLIYDLINKKKYLLLIIITLVITTISYFDMPANISARVLNPGSIGSVTKNDLEVLKYIENHYKEFSNGTNNYNEYSKAPKTMLFPIAVNSGTEKWLFPVGAASVYPLHNTYPPVFFYGLGSENYSYEVFSDLSTGILNFSWLINNNVKYAYLPDDRGGVDNDLVKSFIENSDILFQSGNSIFLEIPSEHL